ncbi:MAG TPA: hypothetical protein PKY12_05475, partial [Catalimonadaceae bacterium]|nr:hypothetical protein [Catalimonadaceae bacterium]
LRLNHSADRQRHLAAIREAHLSILPSLGEDASAAFLVENPRITGNQLALFKNPFKSNFYGFLFAGIGQIILTIWMYKLSKTKSSENSDFGLVFCQLGLFYLLFIIPVRMHYYFAESFDCRLLGPGFLLLIPGLASRFSAFQSGFRPGKWLAIYMIISSLFFLPKNEILNFIQNSTFRN